MLLSLLMKIDVNLPPILTYYFYFLLLLLKFDVNNSPFPSLIFLLLWRVWTYFLPSTNNTINQLIDFKISYRWIVSVNLSLKLDETILIFEQILSLNSLYSNRVSSYLLPYPKPLLWCVVVWRGSPSTPPMSLFLLVLGCVMWCLVVWLRLSDVSDLFMGFKASCLLTL